MSKQPDKEPKDNWIAELDICSETLTFDFKRIYALDDDGMNIALATIPFVTVAAKDEIGAFRVARSKLHCLGINPSSSITKLGKEQKHD